MKIHIPTSDEIEYKAIIATILFVVGALWGAIDAHVYSPVLGYSVMAGMVALDAFLGVWIALKFKRYDKAKLLNAVANLLAYTVVLAIAHNLRKSEPLLFWLPQAVFVPVVLTVFISIIKNLSLLGFLSRSLTHFLSDRVETYKNQILQNHEPNNDNEPKTT